ncbi:hypothetical protein CEXT_453651 [Caerostris extrusa]|uniref:Ycf15 n=1 Tax=Caerostris extrusa TaxID=172846 RepID=A0AAV4THR3_CAEEX|nr:hypothetical protein CEXT_453651 [Caerostris extrusa]
MGGHLSYKIMDLLNRSFVIFHSPCCLRTEQHSLFLVAKHRGLFWMSMHQDKGEWQREPRHLTGSRIRARILYLAEVDEIL